MKPVGVLLMSLLCAAPVWACTTEEVFTALITDHHADVTIAGRHEGIFARRFMTLFTEALGRDPATVPPIEVIVVYAKPDATSHKVIFFTEGCVIGNGYITREAYTAIVEQLHLARSGPSCFPSSTENCA